MWPLRTSIGVVVVIVARLDALQYSPTCRCWMVNMYQVQPWHYLVIPTLILVHQVISPYTKVEESFNIQAIHDILEYGVPVSNVYNKFVALFDHMTFSGAVPRTFIGALVTAAFSRPLIWLGGFQGMAQQMIARSFLGLLNAWAFTTYTRAVSKAYGGQTALWYIALQASQFHVLYYASRTLPNSFAFCLTTFAMAANLPDPTSPLRATKRFRLTLYLLTLAAIVFRGEVALLLASQSAYQLLKIRGLPSQLTFVQYTAIPAVLTATLVGLVLTVGIDTYFWQSSTLLWPEASAFLSNVLPNKGHAGASAWGTSPWHWYFTSAIPRLVGPHSVLMLLYGLLFSTQCMAILDQLIPALGYIGIYSILPHKETRFSFPIVPSLTLGVALSASFLAKRRQLILKRTTIAFALLVTITGLISHAIILPLSAQGYPGGDALQTLHNYHTNLSTPANLHPKSQPQINVHLTNLALQTGVTLFLEQPVTTNPTNTAHIPPKPPKWIYDKTSSSTVFASSSFWSQFDYVIVEEPSTVQGGAWSTISEIKALRRARPRLLGPSEQRGQLLTQSSAPHGESSASTDGIHKLLTVMYGSYMARVYALIHDILREGMFLGGRSLTRGRWVDWGVETRLYILRRTDEVSGR